MSRVVVRAYGITDTGQRRKNNEDTFLIADLARLQDPPVREQVLALDASEDAILLAVSDGMGGAEAGEVASAMVVAALRRALAGRDAMGGWDAAIRHAVERANAEVWQAAKAPGRHGMGATLTTVCIHGGQAHVAVVGDSRAYLLRNGVIRQMTKDQSFVQFLVDTGALKPEEAEGYAMKNVVLQAMGQKPDVEVALGTLELRLGDRLLLCSDGLSNKISAEDMRAIVDRAPTLPGACWELVELANGRGGDDNITVVIAELAGEGLDLPGAQESLTKTFHVITEFKGLAALEGSGADTDEEDGEGPAIVAIPLSPSAPIAAPAPPSSPGAASPVRVAGAGSPGGGSPAGLPPASTGGRTRALVFVAALILLSVVLGLLLLQR